MKSILLVIACLLLIASGYASAAEAIEPMNNYESEELAEMEQLGKSVENAIGPGWTMQAEIVRSLAGWEGRVNGVSLTFTNKKLLEQALTHPSAKKKSDDMFHYQRLEFLGDSVLQICITEYLYKAYPDYTEGELTRLRSSIVSEKALAQCARNIELGNYIQMGLGAKITQNNNLPSILSDVFEAICAAIYIDKDYTEAKKFILTALKELIANAGNNQISDYKTIFQEWAQQSGTRKIIYSCTSEGPAHDAVFKCKLYLDDEYISSGEGSSKKQAEQAAAHVALKNIER
jgi:ribonuclease-3